MSLFNRNLGGPVEPSAAERATPPDSEVCDACGWAGLPMEKRHYGGQDLVLCAKPSPCLDRAGYPRRTR